MHYIVVLPNDATNLPIFFFVFLFFYFYSVSICYVYLALSYQNARSSYARYHHLTHSLRTERLESAAIISKSDLAATKLRYEQQVHNLQTENQVWHLAFFCWFGFLFVLFLFAIFCSRLFSVPTEIQMKTNLLPRFKFVYYFFFSLLSVFSVRLFSVVLLLFGYCRNNANDSNVIEIHSSSYLRRQRKRSKSWNRIADARAKRLWIAATKMINRKSWRSSKR